ncbi:uncharacterized protein LOC143281319 [Babylonia areolata]|uniref:uncharacterized protein LOC143281319 n=1 Tax=Babylonia areolata TaxID=304850 RepID=UPI003FD2BF76
MKLRYNISTVCTAAAAAAAIMCTLVDLPTVWGQTRLCQNYTPTLDGGQCTADVEVCEFKLVVTNKLTLTKDDGTGLFVDSYDVYREVNGIPLSEEELRDVVVGDGATPNRLVTVVNGTMPGPCLMFFKDQTVRMHVVNELTSYSLTIHWHGLDMFHNSYMDGVAFVSQCPIQPGATFVYDVSARQPGFYWYHSHLGAQRSMGLLGPLVVLNRHDNLPSPDHHRVMVLQDWNHDFVSDHVELGTYQLENGKMERRGPTSSLDTAKLSGFPFHSGLINGRGRYYTRTSSPAVIEFQTPLEVFEVEKGEDYRFRVVGAGVIYPFRVSVEGHRIQVVATDGHDFHPVPAESLVINPGERFDFILTANQTEGNYMILAETLEVNLKVRHVAEAVLHYNGSSPVKDRLLSPPYLPKDGVARGCLPSDNCTVVNCPFSYYPIGDNTQCVVMSDLKAKATSSQPQTEAPTAASSEIKEVFLNFAFPSSGGKSPASVNGVQFQWPPVPAILRPKDLPTRCDPADNCGEKEVLCHCTHTVTLTWNAVHQLVLLDLGTGAGFSHPVHIHGYSFYVVKMGYPDYDPNTGHFVRDNEDVECVDTFCNKARWTNRSWTPNDVPGLNLLNPIRKDTIIVPTGGYVVLRLRADNPGMWFVHCHIELHHVGGMALILDGSQEGLKSPPKDFPTCDNFETLKDASSGRPLSLDYACVLLLPAFANLLRLPFLD